MHDTRKVFLLEETLRCVKAAYEIGDRPRLVEYKTFNTSIEVGMYLVVPTQSRHEMAVVKVHEVDIEPDLSSDTRMDWVVDTIDRDAYAGTLASEKSFINAARSAERRRMRETLKKDVLADLDANVKVLGGPAAPATVVTGEGPSID